MCLGEGHSQRTEVSWRWGRGVVGHGGGWFSRRGRSFCPAFSLYPWIMENQVCLSTGPKRVCSPYKRAKTQGEKDWLTKAKAFGQQLPYDFGSSSDSSRCSSMSLLSPRACGSLQEHCVQSGPALLHAPGNGSSFISATIGCDHEGTKEVPGSPRGV